MQHNIQKKNFNTFLKISFIKMIVHNALKKTQ